MLHCDGAPCPFASSGAFGAGSPEAAASAQQIDFLGAVCKGQEGSLHGADCATGSEGAHPHGRCPLRGGSRFLKLPWRALGQGVQATADISGRGAGQHLLPGRGRTVQAGEKTADLVPDAKENPLHRQIGLTQGQIAMQERQAAGKRLRPLLAGKEPGVAEHSPGSP